MNPKQAMYSTVVGLSQTSSSYTCVWGLKIRGDDMGRARCCCDKQDVLGENPQRSREKKCGKLTPVIHGRGFM